MVEMASRNSATTRISLSVVLAATVTVSTMLIRIPIPATAGYLNFGDIMIFVSGLLFGPLIGGFAGGAGSAIADIIGFPAFAPYTLVIKGLEGFLAGSISKDCHWNEFDQIYWSF